MTERDLICSASRAAFASSSRTRAIVASLIMHGDHLDGFARGVAIGLLVTALRPLQPQEYV